MIHCHILRSALVVLAISCFASCVEQKKKRVIDFPKTDLGLNDIIPKPLNVNAKHGGFALDEFTAIYTSENAEGQKVYEVRM